MNNYYKVDKMFVRLPEIIWDYVYRIIKLLMIMMAGYKQLIGNGWEL